MIAAIAAQTTPGMAAPIQGAIAPETAMECEITEAAQRIRESAIPNWHILSAFTQVIWAIDAPEGVDTIVAVGGQPAFCLEIWDTSILRDIDDSGYPNFRAWLERVERQPRFMDDLEPYPPNASVLAGRSTYG